MILCYEVKQHGCFFLYRRIKILPAESLIYLPYGTLERIVFLIGEPLAAAKLGLQFFDSLHGSFVGSTELGFVCGLLHSQLLVIVLVQSIKSISIVGNHFHQIERIIGSQCLLCLDRPAQDGNQLLQLHIALFCQSFIDGIAFYQIFFQHPIGPSAKVHTFF